MMRVRAVLLSMVAVGAACHRPPALDAEVTALAADGRFSGAIVVERRGAVVLRKGYGLADREHAVANAPTAKFRIGSLTKALTAAAVLVLVDRGRLRLDDPLGPLLHDCPEAWRAITVDQLLRHTSGIPDLVRLPGFFDTAALPTTLERSVARIAREPLDWAPGSRFEYGNSGYVVAARLVEQLAGRPYADFLRDEVLTPLGLTDSGTDDAATILPGRARGYISRDGRMQNAPYLDISVALGAGSAYSTVDDLRRFVAALRRPRLPSAPLVARMLTPGLDDYGYGWYIRDEGGRRVVSHVGDINGFGAFVAWLPDEETSVIVLSNLEGAPVREIALRLLGRVRQ